MGTSPLLIAELDTAIQSSSSDKRIATLRRVTDLFLSHAGQYDPAQMKLFDGVLMRMIGHIEARALAELGERLAPIDGAVSDVLVDRGNSEVARKVAVNSGARFSQNGFATLVKLFFFKQKTAY